MSPNLEVHKSDLDPVADASPVGDGEVLMRRVRCRKIDFDKSKTPSLQDQAFYPSAGDTDGLSVNRHWTGTQPSFLTPSQNKTWYLHPDWLRSECGVATVTTQFARSLGITVAPDPLDDTDPSRTPGHAIFKEMTYAALQNDDTRSQIIKWALQLAQKALLPIEPKKSKR